MMPHRTRGWIRAGRVLAGAAVAGLGGYLIAAGAARANLIAAPAALVVALAALLATYLLPVYVAPGATPPGRADGPDGAGQPGVTIIADHGSVAAQHIHQVTMNPRAPGPANPASR